MKPATVKVWKVTGKLGDQALHSVMLGDDECKILDLHILEWTWGTHDDEAYEASAELVGEVRLPMARSDDGAITSRFVQPHERQSILDQLNLKA